MKNVKSVSEKSVVLNSVVNPKKEDVVMKNVKSVSKESVVLNPVDALVVKTNKCADAVVKVVNKQERRLYECVRECVLELKGDEKLLKLYKKGVKQSHRSNVYVMVSVANSPLLVANEDNLPTSYQTLYECLKLLNEVGEETLLELLEEGLLNKESSKANVTKMRKDYAPVTSTTTDDKTSVVAANDASVKDDVVVSKVAEVTDVVVSMSSNERLQFATKLTETLCKDDLEMLMFTLSMKLETLKEAA
jgi:hypothetical protein